MIKNCTQCWKEFEKKEWNRLWNICSFKCRDAKYYPKEKREEYSKKYRKYKTYNCCICGVECTAIDDYRVKGKYNKTCASRDCKEQNQRNINNNINDKKRIILHTDNTDKIHNIFVGKEDIYKDKTINYELSPSWRAYIWLAKAPLIPNDNWIGYKWVLMQSENRSLVQCSECWKWYKIIPNSHLQWHWLTRETYREKFWLNKTQALVSDTYSRFYSSNIVNVLNKEWIVSYENKVEWCKKWREIMAEKRKRKYNTDQMKNNKWTCDLQLKHRFIEYILSHHKYPPINKFPYQALKDRFGSVNNALKEYWLPIRQQIGFSVLYEFNDWYVFKITKWKWYEELYDIMKLKCIAINDII